MTTSRCSPSTSRRTSALCVVIAGTLAASVFAGFGGGSLAGEQPQMQTLAKMPAADRVVVVELFTSEGCSSCPSAESVLSELISADWGKGRSVAPLALHVDYFDRLGWPDGFATPAYTARQREYVKRMGLGSAYTPQMIVQGQKEFVGSDKSKALAAIRAELDREPRVEIALTVAAAESPAGGGASEGGTSMATVQGVTLKAVVKPVPAIDKGSKAGMEDGNTPRVVCFAITESGIDSKVLRGENGGRTLHHDAVVRAFAKVPLDAAGRAEATLTLPAGVDRSKARVVAFVQGVDSPVVVGATERPLMAEAKRMGETPPAPAASPAAPSPTLKGEGTVPGSVRPPAKTGG